MKKKCEKCNGTGKIDKPVSMNTMGKVDCDLCGGTGFLYEDPMPLLIERLDRIISLLGEIKSGGKLK